MVTLYQLKPTFQQWLRPLVNQLAQWQITPNQVTIAAVLLSVGMGVEIACFPTSPWVLLSLPVVLLIRMALNAMDGMLARDYNLSSPLGCLLNELGDAVSDIALYLPFSLVPGISATWIVSIVLLALLSELVGVLGQALVDRRIYSGPMGKSDRAFVFGVIGLLLGLGLISAQWLPPVWVGVIGLQVWTLINRVQAIVREVAL